MVQFLWNSSSYSINLNVLIGLLSLLKLNNTKFENVKEFSRRFLSQLIHTIINSDRWENTDEHMRRRLIQKSIGLSKLIGIRGALDPYSDPVGYPMDFVDPVQIQHLRIWYGSRSVWNREVQIRNFTMSDCDNKYDVMYLIANGVCILVTRSKWFCWQFRVCTYPTVLCN